MSSSFQMATCGSGFGWMSNDRGQDPCTVAGWIIMLCENPENSQPANLAPLESTSVQYLPPNGTSASSCTCSWAFYNSIQACNVCQNSPPQDYESFSNPCNLLGQTSRTNYWQADVSFSSRTQFPRWSILNPPSWDNGTFNATQAEQISQQNLGDVTDTSASQPSVSSSSESSSTGSKKTNVGVIAGGVVAGVIVLLGVAFALWFFLFKRRGVLRPRRRWIRGHIDLNADPDRAIFGDGDEDMAQSGNPLAAHLRSNSLGYAGTNPANPGFNQQQQDQSGFQGYPARSQTIPQPGPNTAIVGFTRTAPHRASRESIPTVAEQLDEKRRIRAERQNPPPVRRRPSVGYAGTVTRTGSSVNTPSGSRSTSMDDLRSGGGGGGTHSRGLSDGSSNNSASNAISQAISRSLSSGATGTGVGGNNENEGDKRRGGKYQRRLSLKNAPWNRRRVVFNSAGSDVLSDVGSDGGREGYDERLGSPNINTDANINATLNPNLDSTSNSNSNLLSTNAAVAPLPLGGTVAAAGHTTTASDVIAAVPGARLPNRRERENPPPEYTS